MPEIARFFGIIIFMLHNDHAPPHFLARYGKAEVAVDIKTLAVLQGRLPPRVMGFVVEWAARHQDELLENWQRAREKKELAAIEPLE